MTEWTKVQGSQPEKPEEFYTTSSEVIVYQRRNIERVNIKNEDGTTSELWEYDERKLTRDEYTLARDAANQEKAIAALENAICELDPRA